MTISVAGEEIGGGMVDGITFKAAQTGGPSGGCLPEQHLDMPVDYDTLNDAGSIMGSGGMIVMPALKFLSLRVSFKAELTFPPWAT